MYHREKKFCYLTYCQLLRVETKILTGGFSNQQPVEGLINVFFQRKEHAIFQLLYLEISRKIGDNFGNRLNNSRQS